MEAVLEDADVANQPARKPVKGGRLSLRATEQQLDMLRKAADAQGRSLTDFVLSTATAKAEEILVERRNFAASPEAWERFMEALDNPPPPGSALVRLFQDPDL